MTFRIYNSITRRKEAFRPLHPPRVGMYVCGVTAYDYSHIGHARVMVVFDVLYRWLQALGYQVTYVRNFTDIDDKIIRKAAETGRDWRELTREMISAFHKDMQALGCLPPSFEPRATDHIEDMIAMIQRLLEKGYAYQASNGDILFSVRRFPEYGALSGKRIDELAAGARVEVEEAKRDPFDFVLWKKAKPGEPAWDSPWGKGRPGWHIECSAMSCRYLGKSFDIHGGGMDLQFPHHENEIAQAKAANDGGFARVWVHNGFVKIRSEKMSKSLGNVLNIRDILKHYPGEVLRFFLLNTHYRSPLEFSEEGLASARMGLDRLYEVKRRLVACGWEEVAARPARVQDLPDSAQPFVAAMNDDLNTPQAIAALFELGHRIHRDLDQGKDVKEVASAFYACAAVLALLQQPVCNWFKPEGVDIAWIEAKIAERSEARSKRDYAKADAIRKELADKGVILEDTPHGTQWRRA